MKRIEFVGGSGVRKTTPLKDNIKLKNVRDCWITVEEVRRNLAKTVKPKRELHKLFQLYLLAQTAMLKKRGLFLHFQIEINLIA